MKNISQHKKGKRFKKVILHVGPNKTGSTSIQFCLNNSRKLLLKNGVFYPLSRIAGKGSPGGIEHQLLNSYFKTVEKSPDSSNEYNEHLITVARDNYYLLLLEKSFHETEADTLILSDEGFTYLSECALIKMKQFLDKYCEKIEIVFYVRAPLSYAKSAMSQRVKAGQRVYNGSYGLPFIDYKNILQKFNLVFGQSQMNIRVFSKDSLPKGNVVLDFLSLFHLPGSVVKKILTTGDNKNPSLSHEASLIGDKMTKYLDGHLPPLEFHHKRKIGALFLPSIKGRKIQLTHSQQEEILKNYAPQREYLAKEFGISLKEEPYSVYQQLSISDDTINLAAETLLTMLVPDFKFKRENDTKNKSKINQYFILRLILTVKKHQLIAALRYRLVTLNHRFQVLLSKFAHKIL